MTSQADCDADAGIGRMGDVPGHERAHSASPARAGATPRQLSVHGGEHPWRPRGGAVTAVALVLAGCGLGDAPDPDSHAEIVYDVPEGASASGLATDLEAKGLVTAAWRWKAHLKLGADGSCLKAGRHKVRKDMDADALLAALCAAPLPTNEPFTVVEGWRLRDVDAALVAKGWIQAGEYIDLAMKPGSFKASFPLPTETLEGYLYPETYMIDPTQFDLHGLMQRQLDTFADKFWTGHQGELGARTLEQVVVMASMIEREEPKAENRPLIAGILWKRVDNGWNLGVDATSRYTLADWNNREAFLVKLRDPKDPYNTRLKPGLPPHPIGNPGVVALEAAIKPTESEYWYYLHDAQQNLHGGRNVGEHEANRRKYNVY